MNIVIASDFDNTITLTNDKTAMTTFEEVLPKEYKEMRERIYKEEKLKQLAPSEIQDYYDKIWDEKFQTFKKYNITKELITSLTKEVTIKKGFSELVNYLNQKNIPFIINSAGLGDFIKIKLETENLMLPNIKIISNFLNDTGEYVTRYNKNTSKEYQKQVNNADILVIIGDTLSDLTLIPPNYPHKVVKIAFPRLDYEDYKNNFDYTIEEENFNQVLRIIKELEKWKKY